MLLTVKSKLTTNHEQHDSLLKTMEKFNEACNYISVFAFKKKTFGKVRIQKELYYEIREKFGLSAQMTVRAVGKVAESYKVDRKTLHEFEPHGAIVYDQRILSYKSADEISILTLDGRIEAGVQYGESRKLEADRVKGQADLIYKNGTFYLMIVVDLPDAEPIIPDDVLGIDLGIVNLATTSDGKAYSGEKCTEVRQRYAKIKASLQSTGTYSAKRHLKKISGRERRFKKDTNHCISKEIVQTARDTNRAIALEDLSGIRERVTVSKAARESIGKWAFLELRNFIEYKAKLAGVPVFPVDPRNTSTTCSVCGYTNKKNRKNQASFVCLACGHTENADFNAAKNIAFRAAVNLPIVLCS
ncbi:IS200/IS605 family element transposase accessory protein TnpB [Methanosarcina sp. KYL-1]|uniref:RNA-guided endonuclease InsQ/TnpB family protein n=1 Tax=Methanosarcina sp. KYL-1 TaxID=2602068 RepID=UPI002101C31C|nr:transposase [Methanosarcina sp. KYL-1]MCQ1536040.1 IS200/IS605 family element transposase accessory protein TnpB [Methanosarcina sp. KYL-1]